MYTNYAQFLVTRSEPHAHNSSRIQDCRFLRTAQWYYSSLDENNNATDGLRRPCNVTDNMRLPPKSHKCKLPSFLPVRLRDDKKLTFSENMTEWCGGIPYTDILIFSAFVTKYWLATILQGWFAPASMNWICVHLNVSECLIKGTTCALAESHDKTCYQCEVFV